MWWSWLWTNASNAMWAGVRFFHRTSDTTYRRIAYGIVAASALVSVPLFDGLFR